MTDEIKSKKRVFKWVLLVLGILVLLLIIVMIAGRGKKPAQTTGQEKVADIAFKLVEVKDKGNVLKRAESQFPQWGEDMKSEGKFIELRIEAQNLGQKPTKEWLLGDIIDDKGRKFSPMDPMKIWEWYPKDNQCFEELLPGSPGKECTMIYEVAQDSRNSKLEVWALGQGITIGLGI